VLSQCLISAALVLPAVGRADEPEYVLRIATVAPDGSPWALVFKQWIREVESGTDHHVRIKTYFNGVAGDELEEGERMRRGELDATTSGHMLCQKVAPSMYVNRLPGLYRSREEATVVMNRLQAVFEAEAHQHGFVLMGTVALGPDVIFTRVPVHSMAELRRLRLWRWDLDEAGILTARAMGLNIVPLPLSEAARAFDEGRVDGFIAIPTAALSFQWSVRARYLIDLRESYLAAGMLITERAFDALPIEYQQVMRNATASMILRFDAVGQRIDGLLLGGLFQKQGVSLVPISDEFREEYAAAAAAARPRVVEKFVPGPLHERLLNTLDEYRRQRAGVVAP
jgi:TRAP-type C4-dicarboxylate transport system substrate-binding protein